MDNEPYRDLTHDQIIIEVCHWLRSQCYGVKTEHVLPDGKVADIIALHPGGAIHIYECKTLLTYTNVGASIRKYYQWCNALWMAATFVPRFSQSGQYLSVYEGDGARKVGMLEVKSGQIEVLKDACAHTLDPVTRARIMHDYYKP